VRPNHNVASSPASATDAAAFDRSWQSQIDLVITIGGDGTMLHAAGLFPAAPPPICSFFSGNAHFPIGFLSPHPPREFERVRRELSEELIGRKIRVFTRSFLCELCSVLHAIRALSLSLSCCL
jgi:NAD kinase